MALLTLRELALWAQRPEDEVAADPFAEEVIDKVSGLLRFLGGHDEWALEEGENQAPYDVRMVALSVARRCYVNPGQVVAEGSVGPIGGDRVLDIAALLLSLTEAERATVTKYNADGDPDATGNGIYTIALEQGPDTTVHSARLYVGDDQQINLGQSNDPREWMIPMFHPSDPGGDL